MTTKTVLHKLEKFVEKQINNTKNSLTLAQTKVGYKVNTFVIANKDDMWEVINDKGNKIASLRSRRLAVLKAALLVRKNLEAANSMHYIDSQLYTLKHDKNLFEYKITSSNKAKLFEDRLSKTQCDLDQLYSYISDLEKSVGLQ